MAVFSFRLQNVLNLKEKLENQTKIELANAIHHLTKQEEILLNCKNSLYRYSDKLSEKNGKNIIAKELIELNSFIEYYKDEVKNKKKIVDDSKNNVIIKREVLNQALIEKKTYENLHEIAFDEFREEEKQADNKQMDELNSYNQLLKVQDF